MELKHIKSKIFFVTVTTAVLLACMMVILPFTVYATASDPAVSYTDLGAAKGYNLVCFGDFSNHNADVEGYSMIGGSIAVNTFGFGNALDKTPVQYTNMKNIFGSNFNSTANSTIKGKTAFGLDATVTGLAWSEMLTAKNGGQSLYSSNGKTVYFNGNNIYFVGGMTVETPIQQLDLSWDKAYYADYFNTLKTDLANKSLNLSNYAKIPTVQSEISGNTFNLTNRIGNNYIFNISAEDLSTLGAIHIAVDPEAALDFYVIINVTGDVNNGTVKLPGVQWGESNAGEEIAGTRILWNLSSAANITNQESIYGSVLAPNATFSETNNGHYIGTFIVNQFADNASMESGYEGHNYPFGGQIPQISDDESSVASSQASSVVSSQVSSSQPSSGSSSKSPSGLETISEESTPLANPSSRSSSGRPSSGTEDIPDESTPLTPPKTGEAALPAAVSVLAAASLITMAVLRRNRK